MKPIQLSIPTPFFVGPVNGWLLPGDEPTLVDVGPRTDEAWAALVAGLASHGLAPHDLRHVFITHSHSDHYGNARRLAEAAPRATFYAPDLAHARPLLLHLEEEWERQRRFTWRAMLLSGLSEAEATRGWQELVSLRRFAAPAPVDRWLQPGERLALGDGQVWEVVALPGHSMTQIGLRQADERLLISADHLLSRISSNAILEPPAPGEQRRPRALPRYIETLRWTASLPPHHFFPGHGLPFFDQGPLIARRLQGIEERVERLRVALVEGPRPVIALVRDLFPDLNEAQTFLAISEVVGHLDVLEERRQVAFGGETVREYYLTGHGTPLDG